MENKLAPVDTPKSNSADTCIVFFLTTPFQTIRVFEDATGNNFTGCEVVTTDGKDATSYLQSWTDKSTGYSKDAGVRFNHALGPYAYFPETQTWDTWAGSFSIRAFLPESAEVSYHLRCNAAKSDLHYRANWTVTHQLKFTDKASFLKNVCERATTPSPQSSLIAEGDKNHKRDHETKLKEQLWEKIHRRKFEENQRSVLGKRALGEAAPSPRDFPDAVFVAGDITAVYQLTSQPHIGVLVVPTIVVYYPMEIPRIQRYMTVLAKRGVTHLIIDTFGNTGGLVEFVSLLVQVLLPSEDKSTAAHLGRARTSPMAVALADSDLKNTEYGSYYEPELYAEKATSRLSRPIHSWWQKTSL